jgi:hypothetical protein
VILSGGASQEVLTLQYVRDVTWLDFRSPKRKKPNLAQRVCFLTHVRAKSPEEDNSIKVVKPITSAFLI